MSRAPNFHDAPTLTLSQVPSSKAASPRSTVGAVLVTLVFADDPSATPEEVCSQQPPAVPVEDVDIELWLGQPGAVEGQSAESFHARRAAWPYKSESLGEAVGAPRPRPRHHCAAHLV